MQVNNFGPRHPGEVTGPADQIRGLFQRLGGQPDQGLLSGIGLRHGIRRQAQSIGLIFRNVHHIAGGGEGPDPRKVDTGDVIRKQISA